MPLSDSFKNLIQSRKERVNRVATIILLRNVRCGGKRKVTALALKQTLNYIQV